MTGRRIINRNFGLAGGTLDATEHTRKGAQATCYPSEILAVFQRPPEDLAGVVQAVAADRIQGDRN